MNWDDHLDKKYGMKETSKREQYAEEFESFKIGTTKNYISLIENYA